LSYLVGLVSGRDKKVFCSSGLPIARAYFQRAFQHFPNARWLRELPEEEQARVREEVFEVLRSGLTEEQWAMAEVELMDAFVYEGGVVFLIRTMTPWFFQEYVVIGTVSYVV